MDQVTKWKYSQHLLNAKGIEYLQDMTLPIGQPKLLVQW